MIYLATIGVLVLVALRVGWNRRHRIVGLFYEPEQGDLWRFDAQQAPMDAADMVLGEQTFLSLVDPTRTHRRVEKLRFDGTTTVRRAVSVDVDIPGPSDSVRSLAVGLIDKRPTTADQAPLRAFDLRGPSGASLALEGHDQNARVAFSALAFGLARVLRSMPPNGRRLGGAFQSDEQVWVELVRTNPELVEILWEIVAQPTRNADGTRKLLEDQELTDPAQVSGSTVPEPLQLTGSDLLAHAMHESVLFSTVVARLASSYLLVVHIPAHVPKGRSIIKYSLADSVHGSLRIWRLRHRHGLTAEEAQILLSWNEKSRLSRVRLMLGRLLGWLGIIGIPIDPKPLTTLPARSFHFEVEAPEGLRFTNSVLRRTVHSQQRKGAPLQRNSRFVADAELEDFPTFTHTFMSHVRIEEQLNALLTFAPSSIRLALLGPVTAVFAVYMWLVPAQCHGSDGGQALLLLIPAIAASYVYVRHHTLVRQVTSGVQVLALLVASSAVAAAAIVAFAAGVSSVECVDGVVQSDIDTMWQVVRWTTASAAVLLIPLSVRSWPNRRLGTLKDR